MQDSENFGLDAGDSNAGSEKDQLRDLSRLANENAGDYVPGGDGIGSGTGGSRDAADGALIAGLVSTICTLVATRRGEHWKLTEDEAAMFGAAADPVIRKYAPDMEASPEFTLIAVTLAVFAPRVMTDLKLQEAANDDEADSGDKAKRESA